MKEECHVKWVKSKDFVADTSRGFRMRQVSVKFNSKLMTKWREDYFLVTHNFPVYAETN
jgi:hypothetical protein